MNTIGQTLKGRRERLGMTLNELEGKTHIKRETLKLIENNDFNGLKKADYAEGFIIKYAKAVNIDSDQLIESHRDEIPNRRNSDINEAIHAFSNGEAPSYRRKDKEPLQLVVVISTVILITILLWILAVIIL